LNSDAQTAPADRTEANVTTKQQTALKNDLRLLTLHTLLFLVKPKNFFGVFGKKKAGRPFEGPGPVFSICARSSADRPRAEPAANRQNQRQKTVHFISRPAHLDPSLPALECPSI
jgi:hypothetical protein